MASFYDELVDLLLAGEPITAVKRLREGSDIGLLDAKRWIEEFSMKVVGPIAGGQRRRDEPVVVGIPGVMGGQPCVSGTRIPAATIAACLDAGSADEEISADYPTLPAGACEAVRQWRSDNRQTAGASEWISPLPPGLPRGQIVYDTHERTGGGRVTYASVVNGSYPLRDGDWHYDLHQIRDAESAHPGQPLGASCRIGEMFEDAAPFSVEHYELQRDPDESDEDYAARRALFETARKEQK